MKKEIPSVQALNLIADFISTNEDNPSSLDCFKSYLDWVEDEGDLPPRVKEIAIRIFSQSGELLSQK